jgi:exodeoxyribonuclease VII large subunit
MPRTPQTQWDFGELFPPAATRQVFSVSELTTRVKRLLEQHLGTVWVTGEVSNLRVQPSGHAYFTLKDAGAQLACVLFRGEAAAGRPALQEGRQVNLRGEVTVYEARGQYQLRVMEIEPAGLGVLQAAFEQLKQTLAARGWFAPERKRPLPRFPHRIGVVTSPAAAAWRDVLHVIERRYAGLEIVLAPCRVQGEGAAEEIAAAVRLLNEFAVQGQIEQGGRGTGGAPSVLTLTPALTQPDESKSRSMSMSMSMSGEVTHASSSAPPSAPALDLILITRGGGSLEDLWAFNEEVVARAIFESAVPVVSAVGHEIDFTIADFVADVRAATPSAAAEIITAGYVASREFVEQAAELLRRRVHQRLEAEGEQLAQMRARLARVHPRRWLEAQAQTLDELWSALLRNARAWLREQRAAWALARQGLVRLRPAQQWRARRDMLVQLRRRLDELARHGLQARRHRLQALEARLRLLAPERVLARGYSITTDAASGAVVRDARQVKPGQRLRTRLARGEILSTAES